MAVYIRVCIFLGGWCVAVKKKIRKKQGSTETRTRILGFRVPGANHYTIEPLMLMAVSNVRIRRSVFFAYILQGDLKRTLKEREKLLVLLSKDALQVILDAAL